MHRLPISAYSSLSTLTVPLCLPTTAHCCLPPPPAAPEVSHRFCKIAYCSCCCLFLPFAAYYGPRQPSTHNILQSISAYCNLHCPKACKHSLRHYIYALIANFCPPLPTTTNLSPCLPTTAHYRLPPLPAAPRSFSQDLYIAAESRVAQKRLKVSFIVAPLSSFHSTKV
jgi:hypothetical protein